MLQYRNSPKTYTYEKTQNLAGMLNIPFQTKNCPKNEGFTSFSLKPFQIVFIAIIIFHFKSLLPMLTLFFSFKSMVSLISFDAELPKTRGREVLNQSKCCIFSQNISVNQLEYFMNKIVKIITVK